MACETTGVFLGIGANLGDRAKTLRAAVRRLHETPDVRVVAGSPVYESAPVGVVDQPAFLNAVLEVATRLTARELLDRLLAIEQLFGRVRKQKWGPRTLDLDILLFGSAIIAEPALQVPHPYMLERGFVLAPLCDLAPGRVHPVTGKTFSEHALALDFSVGLRRIAGLDLPAGEEQVRG